MFTESSSGSSSDKEPSLNSRSNDPFTLDVEYEICSKFMKTANEQLYHKEL